MSSIIKIEAKLTWLVIQEEGYLLAKCEPLQVALQGEDLDDLQLNIKDGLQLLFADLVSSGQFDLFMRQRGWSTNSPLPGVLNWDICRHGNLL